MLPELPSTVRLRQEGPLQPMKKRRTKHGEATAGGSVTADKEEKKVENCRRPIQDALLALEREIGDERRDEPMKNQVMMKQMKTA